MGTLRGAPVVEVTRGPIVESIHEITACAVNAAGDVLLSCGSIDVSVYLRSTAKPFIAAAAIREDVAQRFGLEQREIAVMAASHSGEPFHVEAVRSILEKIGLDESALQCGVHAPYNAKAAHDLEEQGIMPTAIHNNCSGKHAGILALCKAIGSDPATYMQVSNLAQQRILELCARVSDDSPVSMPLGVDGCGIPVYATPLRNAALSFARFATLTGLEERDALALRIVRDAMIAYPEYVSGTAEFDAVLMHAGAGNIACKAGAEGVHGTAAIAQGIGFVAKVVDGASRGRGPAVIAALQCLDILDERQATQLGDFARPVVYNRAGRAVGEVRADAQNFAVEKASFVDN